METNTKTTGFGGGITNAEIVRAGFRSAEVCSRAHGSGSCVAASKKDARQQRQLRTGASNCSPQMTEDSLSHLPFIARATLTAVAALTLSGVLPMALCALLMAVFDVVGYWPLVPMFIGALCAMWRVVLS